MVSLITTPITITIAVFLATVDRPWASGSVSTQAAPARDHGLPREDAEEIEQERKSLSNGRYGIVSQARETMTEVGKYSECDGHEDSSWGIRQAEKTIDCSQIIAPQGTRCLLIGPRERHCVQPLR